MIKNSLNKPEDCRNIDDIRYEIDLIDNQVIWLIAQRAQYVKEAAKFKKSEDAVRDEERVKKVIESKKQLALEYNISPDLIGEIYRTMIEYFVNQELDMWKKVK
jgi:isochorismate pyruvate lyase